MSWTTLLILALGMSMDAFAAAVVKGASLPRLNIQYLIGSALIFGVIEAIAPLIGWLGGSAAQSLIANIDHWIAFILLSFLGIRMMYNGMCQRDETEENTPPLSAKSMLVLTALGTSMDSMVVGVSLAFLDVNIWSTALLIGASTTVMTTCGMVLGHYLGQTAGRHAELLGGMVLVGIGTFILLDHLNVV